MFAILKYYIVLKLFFNCEVVQLFEQLILITFNQFM